MQHYATSNNCPAFSITSSTVIDFRNKKPFLQLCASHLIQPTSLCIATLLPPRGRHLTGLSPDSFLPNIDITGTPAADAIWTGPESFEINKDAFLNNASNSPRDVLPHKNKGSFPIRLLTHSPISTCSRLETSAIRTLKFSISSSANFAKFSRGHIFEMQLAPGWITINFWPSFNPDSLSRLSIFSSSSFPTGIIKGNMPVLIPRALTTSREYSDSCFSPSRFLYSSLWVKRKSILPLAYPTLFGMPLKKEMKFTLFVECKISARSN